MATEQLEIRDIDEPDYTPAMSVAERFAAFHAHNPHVYEQIVKLCRLAKSKGRERWSVKAAIEVLRWNRLLETASDDYRVNNNYGACYARLIMKREPDLSSFFETRRASADDSDA